MMKDTSLTENFRLGHSRTGFITLFLTLLASLLLFSCEQDKKQVIIPGNVLPKEKMARVITDIHIAEAEISLNSPPEMPDSTLKEAVSFQKIFEKDSLTKQQYENSLNFYMDHPELLDTIYVQVLNELSKMQVGK